ncbi:MULTISPECIES: helix-turn-helix domain-containing protein [unclassified Novosphingobium]|uniref:AraC family transcriptional regulator n=1 Tax=unclassified Novosphingobium TaxID=2644732 RepID=UPI0025E6B3D0|nr:MULTISPECIES: helix-turn-helix domain-containing protein [unclassified Novosphingobium]HQV02151.1 helix-turn-helix domain-containing protein [Novosphingobium sp.]
MSSAQPVEVRFYPPPEDLRGYFTTFYYTEIDPGEAGVIYDSLHPEWAGVRFFSPGMKRCWFDGGSELADARFIATGPSSHPLHFEVSKTRIWGVGLLPLGWAKYVDQPASECANWVCDGYTHPATAHLTPLADTIYGDEPDEAAELRRIITFFRNLERPDPVDENRILAVHAALVDTQVATVNDLVERVAASQRTVERLCHRYFGFSPKLLLRRQRFMRSLAQFMLDPSLKWIGAMDPNYHDQAQFVRDFREFMGMAPREYAAQPHPVLERFLHERMKAHGAPVQTLDKPSMAPVRVA